MKWLFRLFSGFVILSIVALACIVRPEKWQPLDSVVKLEATGTYGDTWQGTAFFVADDLIMTAGHCVKDAEEVWIVWADGKKHKAVSWYYESEADIGVVYIRTLEVEQNLNFDKAKLGEDCWALGNPYGEYPILNKGTISAIEAPDTFSFQKDMIVVDCPLHPGNSGSPIFDMDNNVLGVCSWGYSPVMTYCVRAEICELVLEKYLAIKALEGTE